MHNQLGVGCGAGRGAKTDLLILSIGSVEPGPQVVAHTALLQQHLQTVLALPQRHDPPDVLLCSHHQGRLQHRVGHGLAALEVQQRQVDVAGRMRREPRLQRGCLGGFAFAVERREDTERAHQHHDVAQGCDQGYVIYHCVVSPVLSSVVGRRASGVREVAIVERVVERVDICPLRAQGVELRALLTHHM